MAINGLAGVVIILKLRQLLFRIASVREENPVQVEWICCTRRERLQLFDRFRVLFRWLVVLECNKAGKLRMIQKYLFASPAKMSIHIASREGILS